MTETLPRLYVIADLDFVGDARRWLKCLAALDAVAEPHRLAIQVRAKGLDRSALADAARLARRTVARAPLVLNGPPRLADALGYDGIHWPEAGVPASPAACASMPAIRTAAVHAPAAVAAAERAGATALVFAPVYAPGSKRAPSAGLGALRETVAAATVPVYALGGVTPARVAACMAAGAGGIAVLSGVVAAADPAAAAGRFVAAMGAAPSPRHA